MSIQRYVEQLIEEIDEKMNIPHPASIRNLKKDKYSFKEDETDEIMEYHGIPVTSFSNILKESLPPPEKLNEKQSEMLVDKISLLLESWNFHLEYPEITPVKEKYRLIYEHWEEFQVPTSGWHFHQDFCLGNCEDCEVKNYCDTYLEEQESPVDLNLSDTSDENEGRSSNEDGTDRNSENEFTSNKDEVQWILNSIQDRDFIPSIHNYCDRWCNMCSLRSQCSAYYFEKELPDSRENSESGKSSIEGVKHIFELTQDILKGILEENSIDFELPRSTTDNFFPEIPENEQKVLDFAKEYAFSASDWLKEFPEERISAIHELMEPVNVISYYHTFIPSKLARAFFGRVSCPEDDPIQNDSNGSAKVALMAIEKSLNSWAHLLKHQKVNEEVILQHCVKLEKLKQNVQRFFPYAQKFVRPGFDSRAE